MTRLREDCGATAVVAMETVVTRVRAWQAAGVTVAAVVGAFDLLHEGHLALLTRAGAEADRLVVAVRDDEWVRVERGASRPVHPAVERAEVLAGLKPTSLVVIVDRQAGATWLEDVRPDVLVLSDDEATVDGAEILLPPGTRAIHVPVAPGVSTTALIDRIRRADRVAPPAAP